MLRSAVTSRAASGEHPSGRRVVLAVADQERVRWFAQRVTLPIAQGRTSLHWRECATHLAARMLEKLQFST